MARASTIEKYNKLIDQKFGRLTVIEIRDEGELKIVCQCECGNKSTPTWNKLMSGDTFSCGCLRKEKLRKAFFARRGNKKTEEMTILDWK